MREAKGGKGRNGGGATVKLAENVIGLRAMAALHRIQALAGIAGEDPAPAMDPPPDPDPPPAGGASGDGDRPDIMALASRIEQSLPSVAVRDYKPVVDRLRALSATAAALGRAVLPENATAQERLQHHIRLLEAAVDAEAADAPPRVPGVAGTGDAWNEAGPRKPQGAI